MASGNEPDRDEGGFLSRWSRRKVQVRQGVAVAEPPVPPVAVAPRAAVPGDGQSAPAPRRPVAALQPSVPVAAAAEHAEPVPATAVPPTAVPPPPTLADVAALTTESDYARFVVPGVDSGVKNAALKKLFTDPHFNIMDGLDTYIDDYGLPDPLPAGMLRQMAQSHALGLFADDPPPPKGSLPAPAGPAALVAPPALPAAPDQAVDLPAAPPTDAGAESPETPPPPKPNPEPTPDEDAALRLQPHDAAGPTGPDPGAGPHAGRPH